jgi:hypothetical protein
MSGDNVVDLAPGWVGKRTESNSATAKPNRGDTSPPRQADRYDAPDPTDPLQTIVPAGEYSVAYLSYETGFVFGRGIYFVRFTIVEPGEYHGHVILRFVNVPKQWQGKKRDQKARSLARSSTLSHDYVSINGRMPPIRVFSPIDLYKDRVLRVKVVTVEDQNIDGKRVKVPKDGRYSKINRIIRQEAGPVGM